MAQHRTQASRQFFIGERLRQVIIRAAVQPAHPVIHRVPRRQQQHPARRTPRPQMFQQRQPVDAWQHNVQYQPVIRRIQCILQALVAVAAFVHRIPLLHQPLRQNLPQRRIILDNQQPHVHPLLSTFITVYH